MDLLDPQILGVVIGIVAIVVALVALRVPYRVARWQRMTEKAEKRERKVSELLHWLQTRRLVGQEVDPQHYGGNIESMSRAIDSIHSELVRYRSDLWGEGYEGVTVVEAMESASKALYMELDKLRYEEQRTSLNDDEYRALVSAFQKEINGNRRKLCLKHKLCQDGYCRDLC
jgi:hypothetical protein